MNDKDGECRAIDLLYHHFRAISLHLLLWQLAAKPKAMPNDKAINDKYVQLKSSGVRVSIKSRVELHAQRVCVRDTKSNKLLAILNPCSTLPTTTQHFLPSNNRPFLNTVFHCLIH